MTFLGEGAFWSATSTRDSTSRASAVPAVFVIQKNQYAYSTPIGREMLNTNMAQRIYGAAGRSRPSASTAPTRSPTLRDRPRRRRAGARRRGPAMRRGGDGARCTVMRPTTTPATSPRRCASSSATRSTASPPASRLDGLSEDDDRGAPPRRRRRRRGGARRGRGSAATGPGRPRGRRLRDADRLSRTSRWHRAW